MSDSGDTIKSQQSESQCKLCCENRYLCKSHVIPEFFYRPMYDEKHRFLKMSTVPEERTIFQQQGVYERMLCKDCEQHINHFEKHAKKVFFDLMEHRETDNPNEIEIVNLDYSRFKLFQLSVLWRAGVATDPTFSAVKLGQHEERIRDRILQQKPGEPHEYGCIMFGLRTEEQGVFNAMLKPERGRIEGHICYRFVFGSCGWVFLVSRHTEIFQRKKYFVTDSGTVLMTILPAKQVPFIMSAVQDMANAGKLGEDGK